LLWLGHSYVALKAFAKARESYEEVLASQHASEEEKTTAQVGLTTIWGELHYRSGEYEEATKAFEEVLTHSTVNDPNQSGVLLYLVIVISRPEIM